MRRLFSSILLLAALAGAPGLVLAVCTTQPILPGDSSSGVLATDSCVLQLNNAGRLDNYYYQIYKFSGTAGQQIAVTMSSAAVDPYLYLIFPSGRSLDTGIGGGNPGGGGGGDGGGDGGGGGGGAGSSGGGAGGSGGIHGNFNGKGLGVNTSARIPAAGYVTLTETGTYLIEVTTVSAAQTGGYALTLTQATIPTVVEFHNAILNNYFITADPAEANAVDAGAAGPGWSRTGNTFMGGGPSQVCRFYGSVAPGPNSHFYTLDPGECQNLKNIAASTPNTQPRWNFESYDFSSTPAAGGCASGLVPVYRAYNNGFARHLDSNHRITSNLKAYEATVAAGWTGENIVMCASPGGATKSCTYSLAAPGAQFTAAGGSGSTTVTTGAGCPWSASSSASWISVPSGATGGGNGTVGYSVSANASTSSRTATLTVGDQAYSINQAGAAGGACTYTLSAAPATVSASGASLVATVTAQAGCVWAAASDVPWISITAGAGGSGNGTVAFTVAANANANTRTGTLTIAGKSYTIVQAGAVVCTYALKPDSGTTHSAVGGPGNISVIAPAGCAWSATKSASWIVLTAGLTGTGNGTVAYFVAGNGESDDMAGTITIAGIKFTITVKAPEHRPDNGV